MLLTFSNFAGALYTVSSVHKHSLISQSNVEFKKKLWVAGKMSAAMVRPWSLAVAHSMLWLQLQERHGRIVLLGRLMKWVPLMSNVMQIQQGNWGYQTLPSAASGGSLWAYTLFLSTMPDRCANMTLSTKLKVHIVGKGGPKYGHMWYAYKLDEV